MSIETILSAYTRTYAHTHTHARNARTRKLSDDAKLNIYTANRDLRRMKTATRNRKQGRPTDPQFGPKKQTNNTFSGYI